MNIIRTVRWDTAHHENIYAESYRNHKREKASGYKRSNPGGGVVQLLFWDFAGKAIALPPVKENYPGEQFVEWHRKEVFRGEH